MYLKFKIISHFVRLLGWVGIPSTRRLRQRACMMYKKGCKILCSRKHVPRELKRTHTMEFETDRPCAPFAINVMENVYKMLEHHFLSSENIGNGLYIPNF